MKKKSYIFFRFIVFAIIIGGSTFLLFFNPYLEICSWQIKGVEMMDKQEVEGFFKEKIEAKKHFFPQNNFFIFLLKRHSWERSFEKEFKEIKKASISLRNFNEAELIIKEKEKVAILCPFLAEENCFFFDKEGLLFKRSPASQGPFILNIKDKTQLSFKLGDKISDLSLVKAIIYLKENFSDKTSLTIQEIDIFNQNHDFSLITDNNWRLYFDPKEDISRQFHVFKTLLDNGRLNPEEKIEYIDLRIKNRAYIKR